MVMRSIRAKSRSWNRSYIDNNSSCKGRETVLRVFFQAENYQKKSLRLLIIIIDVEKGNL